MKRWWPRLAGTALLVLAVTALLAGTLIVILLPEVASSIVVDGERFDTRELGIEHWFAASVAVFAVMLVVLVVVPVVALVVTAVPLLAAGLALALLLALLALVLSPLLLPLWWLLRSGKRKPAAPGATIAA